MSITWITRGLASLGLLAALSVGAHAFFPESEDVQRVDGNPSPTKEESKVNNYLFQDEQLDLKPTDGLVKVLRTDQKVLTNDFVSAVIPINHAMPREMRNVMRQVTALEGGRAEVIIDNKTKQNYLQVLAPKYMIPYIQEAVAALDVDWLKEYWDGATDVYVRMQHREAAFVDTIASQYAGTEGFTVVDTTNNSLRRYDEDYRTKKYIEAIKLVDIPCNQVMLEVKMYEVNANNDTKLGLDYINWKNGPGRNLWSFIVAGYGADQRAKNLTSVYDPFLDARATVPGGEQVKVLDTAAVETYRAVNYLLTSNYVDFLQSKGQARLVHSENLMVCSANTGTITAEEQVVAFVNNSNDLDTVKPDQGPVFIIRTNTGDLVADKNRNGVTDKGETVIKRASGDVVPPDSDSAPKTVLVEDSDRRLNYRNAGVVTTSLQVTPYVGLSSMELVLDLVIRDLNGIAPSGLPIINERTVGTTVRLLDGQPYVIAGLKRTHNLSSSAKAPFLGSIPGLGYLFGGETNLKRENDLVITVTPHFYLASTVNIATPAKVNTVDKIIKGEQPLGLPSLKLGYDQWLLNS